MRAAWCIRALAQNSNSGSPISKSEESVVRAKLLRALQKGDMEAVEQAIPHATPDSWRPPRIHGLSAPHLHGSKELSIPVDHRFHLHSQPVKSQFVEFTVDSSARKWRNRFGFGCSNLRSAFLAELTGHPPCWRQGLYGRQESSSQILRQQSRSRTRDVLKEAQAQVEWIEVA